LPHGKRSPQAGEHNQLLNPGLLDYHMATPANLR
jgi:hypothetical protein